MRGIPSAMMLVVLQVGERVRSMTDALGIRLEDLSAKAFKAAIVLILAWAGFRMVRWLTRRMERAVADDDPAHLSEREQRARTLAQLLNSVGAVVIGVGAALMVLNLFINIGPLLAGVGVAGLAISFGAQSLVKDVLSGFFILLENQLAVGDVIEINGVAGVVERLTMRVVVLRDVEGVLHTIPNGSIQMVSNKTRGWSRAVLDIGVAYKENVDRIMEVLGGIGDELWNDPEWRDRLQDAPSVLGVQELADSAVTVRMTVNTLPGKQFDVGRELRRRIKNTFDAEGIEIPFPQRTLHLGDADRLLAAITRRPPAG